MSTINEGGALITYMESEVKCPICEFVFDATKEINKAKLPVFKTHCPRCKGAIGISMPIFGGNTECFEWGDFTVESQRVTNITPNKANGKNI